MKVLPKISMKRIGLTADILTKIIEVKDSEVAVSRVMGQITGVESKISRVTDEPYSEFSGTFSVENLLTKEVTRGKKLILPAVAEIPIVDHLRGCNEGDIESTTFAIDVTITPTHATQPNMSKYQWGVDVLTEVAEMDFLSHLSQTLPPPDYVDSPVAEKALETEESPAAPSTADVKTAQKKSSKK